MRWDEKMSKRNAKTLGDVFHKGAYVESEWKRNAEVYFKYSPSQIVSTGTLTALWENLYIQIDYTFSGYQYVEKFLLLDTEEEGIYELHLTAGPYGQDYAAQELVWSKWLEKVKELSEG